MKKILILASLILFIASGTTYASPVIGVPVGSIGSTDPVGYTDANGEIRFFIPLSYSGVYGVGGAGMSSDQGSGFYESLTMFLMYQGIDYPAATAELKFKFEDLDLDGANDPTTPYNFLESIQIFDSAGPVTDLIDDIFDSNDYFSITINNGEVSITIDDFTSSVLDPTYVQLVFSSDYASTGWNTPEYLYTTLETSPVPIPGAFLLFSSGLIGLAGLRRKFRG